MPRPKQMMTIDYGLVTEKETLGHSTKEIEAATVGWRAVPSSIPWSTDVPPEKRFIRVLSSACRREPDSFRQFVKRQGAYQDDWD